MTLNTQLRYIIWDTLVSIDRYVVVFYPCIIYKVNGCLRTLLRGPKQKHVLLYFVFIIGESYSIYTDPNRAVVWSEPPELEDLLLEVVEREELSFLSVHHHKI